MNVRFYVTHDWKGDLWRGFDLEEIVSVARDAGCRSIGYEDMPSAFQERILAEGGICIDPDCHCHKSWEHWRE